MHRIPCCDIKSMFATYPSLMVVYCHVVIFAETMDRDLEKEELLGDIIRDGGDITCRFSTTSMVMKERMTDLVIQWRRKEIMMALVTEWRSKVKAFALNKMAGLFK